MKSLSPWLLVLLLILGCGKEKPASPDAATSPGQGTATESPAPPSAVTLPGTGQADVASVPVPAATPAASVLAPQPGLPDDRPKKIRRPAVAGLFYPEDRAELTKMVDGMLNGAKEVPLPRIRALICPHAGYKYSGKTAALAYRQLRGSDVTTVILMGPPHTTDFVGAAVADSDGFATPLGIVPVSPRAKEIAAIRPFQINPPCRVEARDLARHAPLGPGEFETPHTWEHSLEVQLPFLQRVLPKAEIVPIVVGGVEPIRTARILGNWVDDKTLVIVSTDLSHYGTYDDAKAQDAACVKAICDMNTSKISPHDACGSMPVKVLIELARRRHWKPHVLEAVNSGDTTGDKRRVVGYASIAFCDPSPDDKPKADEKPKADDKPKAAEKPKASETPQPQPRPKAVLPKLEPKPDAKSKPKPAEKAAPKEGEKTKSGEKSASGEKPKPGDKPKSGDKPKADDKSKADPKADPKAAPKSDAKAKPGEVSADQRQFLLKLARDTLVRAVNHQTPPKPDAGPLKAPLTEDRACFVTLTQKGKLRGCIGCTEPQGSLVECVIHKTEDAALRDPRFPPMTADELVLTDIEISVLTPPKKLEFKTPDELLKKLRPNVDGVVLHLGAAQAVYLPQVWEQLPKKVEFLDHLAEKAGRPKDAWREPGTEVLVYQVEAFQEPKH